MGLKTKHLAVLGLIVFVYIVSRVGYETIIENILSLNPLYILPILGVTGGNVLVKSYKWRLVIRAHGADYPLKDSVKVFLIGMFTGLLTPGRAGDLIRALYLNKENVTFGKSASTVVIDRLLDILSLFLLFFLSVIWLGRAFGGFQISMPTALLFLGGVVFLAYLLFQRDLVKKLLRPFYANFLPETYKPALKMGFNDFYDSLGRLDRADMALPAFLSILSWLLTGLEGYLVARSLGLDISYLTMMAFIPLITLAELLPISVSGLGTREVAVISLFSLIGLPMDTAVAFSILYLVLAYWTAAFTGGLMWYLHPIEINSGPKKGIT